MPLLREFFLKRSGGCGFALFDHLASVSIKRMVFDIVICIAELVGISDRIRDGMAKRQTVLEPLLPFKC